MSAGSRVVCAPWLYVCDVPSRHGAAEHLTVCATVVPASGPSAGWCCWRRAGLSRVLGAAVRNSAHAHWDPSGESSARPSGHSAVGQQA